MKLIQSFVIGFLAFSCVYADQIDGDIGSEPRVSGIIDDLINQTVNALLEKLPATISIDSLPLTFNADIIEGTANISNLDVTGVKTIVLSQIDASLSLTVNLTLSISKLAINTNYGVDLTLLQFVPFYGHGKANMEFDNVNIYITGKANITGGLSISNATLAVNLGDALFSFTGILDNEDLSNLVNEVLNDNVVSFFNDNEQAISDIISPIASDLINALLHAASNSTAVEALEELIETYQLE